jgi:hypothetical protein
MTYSWEKNVIWSEISGFLLLAFGFAVRNNSSHPFEGGMADKDCYNGFAKRHPQLSPRAPEQTSAARAEEYNQYNAFFFCLLGDLQLKHTFRPILVSTSVKLAYELLLTNRPK